MAELEPTVQTAATPVAPAPQPASDAASAASDVSRLLVDFDVYETGLTPRFRTRSPFRTANRKQELAELPGIIVAVHVKPGERVAARAPLYTLDAMKMHNVFAARFGGVVRKVHVAPGDKLTKHQVVLEYE